MKKISSIVWGVVLLAVGVIIALNALGITDVSLWFDGWWTLFIIIPSIMGLITDKDKSGAVIGLCIGVILLLGAQDIVDFSLVWKLIVPAVIIIIALKLIFNAFRSGKTEENTENKDLPSEFAAFSGSKKDFSGTAFDGAELNAIFGGIECDPFFRPVKSVVSSVHHQLSRAVPVDRQRPAVDRAGRVGEGDGLD